MRKFYQDRLGTNIGKLKKDYRFLRKKDFVPFTTTAHELRRLIAEAKGANESFIIKYTVRAAVRRRLLLAAVS